MDPDIILTVSSFKDVAQLARTVEDVGFDALWSLENRHEPFTRRGGCRECDREASPRHFDCPGVRSESDESGVYGLGPPSRIERCLILGLVLK